MEFLFIQKLAVKYFKYYLTDLSFPFLNITCKYFVN